MELLWALAARSPHVLIEANFRPYSDYEHNKLTALGGAQVEVHGACPAELAVARYNARHRHPVHVQTNVTPDYLTEFDRPVGIGALVTVDTTAPLGVSSIAVQVRSLPLPHQRVPFESAWRPQFRERGLFGSRGALNAPRSWLLSETL
jgi:hypothetical protein